MYISDNTLKLLKRAVKQDYTTTWKPIPDSQPLVTGDLALSHPDINKHPWYRQRYNEYKDIVNRNAQHKGMTWIANNRQYFPYYAATQYNKKDTPNTYYANKPVKKTVIFNQPDHIRFYNEFLGAKDPQYMQDQQTLAQARRWAKQRRLNGKPVSVAAFNAFRNNLRRTVGVINIDPQLKKQPAVKQFSYNYYPLKQFDSTTQNGLPAGYYNHTRNVSLPSAKAYAQQTFWHPRSNNTEFWSYPASLKYFYDPEAVEKDPETGEIVTDNNPYMFTAPNQFTARMQAMQDFYRAQTGKTALNPQQAMDYISNYVASKGWLKQQGTLQQRLNSRSIAKQLQREAIQPLRDKMGYKHRLPYHWNIPATDWRNYYFKNNWPMTTRFINDNWFNY